MDKINDPLQQKETAKVAFQQIFKVWHSRVTSLRIGVIFSLIALAFGLALMSMAGGRIAGIVHISSITASGGTVALGAFGAVILSSWFLKILGGGRLLMRYVERLYTHNVMFRALSDLRVWFFSRLAKGAAAGLGFRHSGDVLSRLVSDIETLDGLYLRLILPFAGAILTLLVLLVGIGVGDIALALVISVLYFISAFLCPLLSAFITRKRGEGLVKGVADLRIGVLDFIVGLREIRAFGAEGRIHDLLEKKENSLFQKQYEQGREVALMSMIAFFCSQIAILCILAASLNIVFVGNNPFYIVFCLFLTITAFEVVIPLTRAGGLAGQIINAAKRVVGVNKEYPQNIKQGQEEAPEDTHIELKDISFRWSDDSHWVYRHVNLSIKPGEHIAIIGHSGAGKSTLAALLLKVIQPQEGMMTLGGKDFANLSEDSVRQKISWLSQNTHLFDDTIRENLLLGNPNATEQEMWQALSEAAVADVVKTMPNGLDTWLGEGGIKVSGGQGRRIALARTLLSKAPILLLDEPTSGLDADTEAEFFQILNKINSNRTIILIVHRLTGVEKLDKLLRLSDSHLISVNE